MRLPFSWGWRHSWWALVCAGSVLRLWQIATPNLWYDEITTQWMAQLPIERLIAATAGDVHPPLYYMMLWLVAHMVGSSAFLIRLPSAIFSILALALVLRLGRALKFSPSAIVFSTALMAFTLFQIYYAQEARMYALLQLLFIGALIGVFERRWLLLGACNGLMLWTHNYGFIYSLVSTATALIVVCGDAGRIAMARQAIRDFASRIDRKAIARIVVCNVLALASYLPWALVLSGQVADAKSNWWQQPTSPGSIATTFYSLFWHLAMPEAWAAWGALIAFCLIGIAAAHAIQAREPSALYLAGIILCVPIIILVIEAIYRPIWLTRAFIGISAPLFMLIGWAITSTGRRWAVSAVAAIVPAMLIAVLWFYPANTKGASDIVGDKIAAAFQAGDIIMHVDAGTLMGFHAQYNHPTHPQYMLPTIPGSLGTLSNQTLNALGVNIATLESLPWKRAWLVWGAGPTIAQAEDDEVNAILARYKHECIYDWSAYNVPTQDGGVWLLQR